MNMPAKQQKNIQSGLVPSCTAILVPRTTNTGREEREFDGVVSTINDLQKTYIG